MLPVGWLVAAVLVAILATMWFTFTLTRLDRLHARVDAAQASLDAQLVRRAAAVGHIAEARDSGIADDLRASVERAARVALEPGQDDAVRQDRENALGRVVTELSGHSPALDAGCAAELHEAATRVLIARRFYNDAVRDTRALRSRPLPRVLRMAGRRELPQFFDIDDTVPAAPVVTARHRVGQPGPARQSNTEEDR